MENLDKYIESILAPEEELLRELDRETHLRVVAPRMISGHEQGELLKMLTRIIAPRNVLEIGTFTGYSTLCFAAGLGDGAVIDTIEVDDELEALASSFFARSTHRDKIRQHIGSALDIAPRLGKVFDLVFIDGDKREYPDYYRMLMGDNATPALVGSGSVMIADNILWYGKVAQADARDLHTTRIREFNRMVAADPRVEQAVIPIRDGMSIVRVR